MYALYEFEVAQSQLQLVPNHLEFGRDSIRLMFEENVLDIGYGQSRAVIFDMLRARWAHAELRLPAGRSGRLEADSNNARWVDLHYDIAVHAWGFHDFGVDLRLLRVLRTSPDIAEIAVTDGSTLGRHFFSLKESLVSTPENIAMQFLERDSSALFGIDPGDD